MEYSVRFKNWVKELSTEPEGCTIINNKGLIGLEDLFVKSTGKSPFKKVKCIKK